MLEIKGELKDYVLTIDKGLILTICTKLDKIPEDELMCLKSAKNGLKINLSVWHEKRSLDANAYCWKLLDEIAKKIKSTKELVYKQVIQKVGVFEMLPIKNVAVDTFIERWQSKGLGWLCEKERDSTLPNYTVVIAYYGTSTYNTEEMNRFIDEVVFEAEELGIQTKTPDELAEIKSLWEGRNENKTK